MTNKMLFGEEDRMLPWACERIGIPSFHPDAKTIGLERDGKVCAVVIFDSFSRADCSMHVASDGSSHWLTKSFLVACFMYPFEQLNLRRVTGLIASKNTKALRFNQHLGFEREGLCRNALLDDDLVILGLLRENCRFLSSRFRPWKK